MISALGEDPNWRVRHATLLLLPVLADMLDPAAFSHAFVGNPSGAFEQRATDSFALIRSDWIKACVAIGQLSAYSHSWLISEIVPILRACAAEKRNYQRRAVLLDGLAHLGARLRSSPRSERHLVCLPRHAPPPNNDLPWQRRTCLMRSSKKSCCLSPWRWWTTQCPTCASSLPTGCSLPHHISTPLLSALVSSLC